MFHHNYPQTIVLPAIMKSVDVHYESQPQGFLDVHLQPNTLLLRGATHKYQQVRKILQHWLRVKAKTHLLPWLQQLSEQTQLQFHNAQIRNQKTLWGSCNSKKKISLNCKLLFLPPHLVQHILLHELCHLTHLNHSKAFWDLLTHFDSHCHAHKKEMRKAHLLVPEWA